MRFPADWTIEDQQEWLEDYARDWYDKHKPTSKVPEVFEEAFDNEEGNDAVGTQI